MKSCVITSEGRAEQLNADFYQVKYCGSFYNIWHHKDYIKPEIYRVIAGNGLITGSITKELCYRKTYLNVLKSLYKHNRVKILEDCLSEHTVALWLRDNY